MSNMRGRGISVEIAATFGTVEPCTAVTLANPGVATSASHALNDNDVGYFSDVTGMVQLEGQACRVKNKATNTFELQGLNTAAFSAFTAGDFTPAATWSVLSEATRYNKGGGAGTKLPSTTLLDVIDKTEQGNLPAQTVTIDIFSQTSPSAAMQLLIAAAQSGGKVLMRVRDTSSGAVRIFYGEPSLPGEDLGVGALGTGSFDIAVKGYVLDLSA